MKATIILLLLLCLSQVTAFEEPMPMGLPIPEIIKHKIPDLTITNIEFEQGKTEEILNGNITIKNIGNKVASGIELSITYDNEFITSKSRLSLNPKESIIIPISHTFYQEGNYQIIAIVDPYNLIRERNENNNELTKEITIEENTLPDLFLRDIDIYDIEDFSREICIEIINEGNSIIEGFDYYINYGNDHEEFRTSAQTIEPNEEADICLEYDYEEPGIYQGEVILDIFNEIEEINENNNQENFRERISPKQFSTEFNLYADEELLILTGNNFTISNETESLILEVTIENILEEIEIEEIEIYTEIISLPSYWNEHEREDIDDLEPGDIEELTFYYNLSQIPESDTQGIINVEIESETDLYNDYEEEYTFNFEII